MANPRIATGSYTGTGFPGRLLVSGSPLNWTPEELWIWGETKQARRFNRRNWQGGGCGFGSITAIAADGVLVSFTDDGVSLSTHADVNAAGVVYHWLAFGGDLDGFMDFAGWQGYAGSNLYSAGANRSVAVDCDIWKLRGTVPEVIIGKRDSTTRAGFFVKKKVDGSTFCKPLDASTAASALMAIQSDGTMSLSADPLVNENNLATIGEAIDAVALVNSGAYWHITEYTGTGAALTVSVKADSTPIAAFVIPHAVGRMVFNFGTMGANSGSGAGGSLTAQQITAFGSGTVSIGTDSGVNTASATYTLLTFYANTPSLRKAPYSRGAIPRSLITTQTDRNGYVPFREVGGADVVCALAGAYTLVWVGQVGDRGINPENLIVRANGSRSTPAAASFNWALIWETSHGFSFAAGDRMPSNASYTFNRFRTGLRPRGRTFVAVTHDGADKMIAYDYTGKPYRWRRQDITKCDDGTGALCAAHAATPGLYVTGGSRYAAGAYQEKNTGPTKHECWLLYNAALTPLQIAQIWNKEFRGFGDGVTDNLVEGARYASSPATGVAITTINGTADCNAGGTISWDL